MTDGNRAQKTVFPHTLAIHAFVLAVGTALVLEWVGYGEMGATTFNASEVNQTALAGTTGQPVVTPAIAVVMALAVVAVVLLIRPSQDGADGE
jgi:hypothetical protein